MKSRAFFLRVSFWILVAVFSAISHAGSGPTAVEVDADRLKIDSVNRNARFDGHVKARYRDIRISCGSMQVTWDSSQNLISLKATGAVRLQRGDAVATADRATLSAQENTLTLDGNPSLLQGVNRLTGKQIEVNLETSKIEVIEARGTFVLGAGAP